MGSNPTSLGKYRIEGVLGEGAMGVVYKGYDPQIERTVAIKTIRKRLIEESDEGAAAAERFRNEARAAGRLQHAGIVSIYEFGEDVDQAYIAMEYVPGTSLAQHLASYASREQTLPVHEVHVLMSQLLAALEYAHEQGVWHRDIKPANLIITTEGRVKVADFGIARLEDSSITQTNVIIGTPSHMSPEQYMGAKVDRRIDIWACGVVLYQLLTNRLPFTGSPTSRMYKTLSVAAEPPSTLEGAHSPAYFDAIVARALAKKADDRFQTAREFRQALALAAEVEPRRPLTDTDSTIVLAPLVADATQIDRLSLQLNAPTTTNTRAAISNFDPQLLKELEVRLARELGPVARLLVRRAAASATDETSLRALLSEHFTSLDSRSSFLAGNSSPPARASVSAFANTRVESRSAVARAGLISGIHPIADPDAHSTLTLEFIDKATQVLAKRVGPIAKVMIRRASQRATDQGAFCKAVCEQIDDARERSKLAAELAEIK